jgi:hypothetical protein
MTKLKQTPVNLVLVLNGLLVLTIPVFLYYPDLSYFSSMIGKVLITVFSFLIGIVLILIPFYRLMRSKEPSTVGASEYEKIASKNVKAILKNRD